MSNLRKMDEVPGSLPPDTGTGAVPDPQGGFTSPSGAAYTTVDTTKKDWGDLQSTATKVAATGVAGGTSNTAAGATGAERIDAWKQRAGGTSPTPLSPEDLHKTRNFIADCKNIVSLLQTALDIATVILQIVNALQTDVKNWYKPLKITAELLLEVIKDILTSMASTGIYMLPIIPAGLGLEDLVEVVTLKAIKASSGPGSAPQGVTVSQALKAIGTQLRESQTTTSDTFGEFKSVLNSAATSPEDPNRPIFPNAGDKVGGFIIFLDAQADIGDLVHDIQTLLKLFGSLVDVDKLKLEAPKDVSAVAAMLPKDGPTLLLDSDDWVGDATAALLSNSNNYPAIRVSWFSEKVPVPPISGWYVYRLTTPFPPLYYNNSGDTVMGADGRLLRDYTDPTFNDGEPVLVHKKEFVDFEVTPGTTYFYWVAPGVRFMGKLRPSSAYSNVASATATSCIPDNKVSVFYGSPAGFMAGPPPGSSPYWRNITVRDLLGKQIDLLYKNIYESIQKLFASAETAVDQNNDLINLLKEKLAQLQDVLDATLTLIETLAALKFSANSMYLYLDIQEGGMKHFLERVEKAKPPEEGIPTVAGNGKPSGTSGAAAYAPPLKSTKKACSVYAAVVVLAGYPGSGTFSQLNVLDKNNALRKSAKTQASASLAVFQNDANKLGAATKDAVKNSKKIWTASGELGDTISKAAGQRKDSMADFTGRRYKSAKETASKIGRATTRMAGNSFRNAYDTVSGPFTDSDADIQAQVDAVSGQPDINGTVEIQPTRSAAREQETYKANTPSDGATTVDNRVALSRSSTVDTSMPTPQEEEQARKESQAARDAASKKDKKGSRKVSDPNDIQKKLMETIISILGG